MFLSRSLSPVSSMSGEELSAALRRSRRRQGFTDKQMSCDSQELAGGYSEAEQGPLDRVRFDDNVSFIEATSPDLEADLARVRPDLGTFKVLQTSTPAECNFVSIQKCDLETGPLREETAEELAMVVSPQPRRPSPAPVPSIEVLSPWGTSAPSTVWPVSELSGGQVWSPASDHCDQTPLLNVSSPSSDAGQCQ